MTDTCCSSCHQRFSQWYCPIGPGEGAACPLPYDNFSECVCVAVWVVEFWPSPLDEQACQVAVLREGKGHLLLGLPSLAPYQDSQRQIPDKAYSPTTKPYFPTWWSYPAVIILRDRTPSLHPLESERWPFCWPYGLYSVCHIAYIYRPFQNSLQLWWNSANFSMIWLQTN